MMSKRRRQTNRRPTRKHKKRTYKNKQIGGTQEYASYFDLSNITLKEVTDKMERVNAQARELRELNKEKPNQDAKTREATYHFKLYVDFLQEVMRIKIIDEMNAKYFGDRIPPLGGQVHTFDTRGVAEEMLKQNDKPAE